MLATIGMKSLKKMKEIWVTLKHSHISEICVCAYYLFSNSNTIIYQFRVAFFAYVIVSVVNHFRL